MSCAGIVLLLVDSSVWIAYFSLNDGPGVLALEHALRTDEPICIIDIILTEVLQGFRNEREFELARRTLTSVERLPLSYVTYVNAARLHRRLRGQGVTAKTIDCVVAQSCMDARAELLTADSDFKMMARHTRLRLAKSAQS